MGSSFCPGWGGVMTPSLRSPPGTQHPHPAPCGTPGCTVPTQPTHLLWWSLAGNHAAWGAGGAAEPAPSPWGGSPGPGVRGGGSSILFQEWERAGLLDTKGWPNGFGTGTRLSQRMNARRGFGLKRPQVSRGRSQDTSVQRKAKHTPVNAPLCPSGETPPPGPPEAPGSCR